LFFCGRDLGGEDPKRDGVVNPVFRKVRNVGHLPKAFLFVTAPLHGANRGPRARELIRAQISSFRPSPQKGQFPGA